MITETLQTLETILSRNNRIILVGDFNCREVDWEGLDAGTNEGTRGSKLLNLMMENLLTQHIKENTRIRGQDVPSRLDLIYTNLTIKIK